MEHWQKRLTDKAFDGVIQAKWKFRGSGKKAADVAEFLDRLVKNGLTQEEAAQVSKEEME